MSISASTRLRRKLLRIGGLDVDLVVPDPQLEAIAANGDLFESSRIRIVGGAANQCHGNAASLWLKGRSPVIATGYYLAIDGIWHQHSWGVTGSGTILDTHRGGNRYFGIRLDGLQALVFAEVNFGYKEVFRWISRNPERFELLRQEALRIMAS